MPSVSNTNLSPEERLRRTLRVELDQEGADPSRMLTSLAEAMERKAWEKLGLGSFLEFVVLPPPQGIGSTPEDVKTLVRLRHHHEKHDPNLHARLEEMRQQVRSALNPELPGHGGDRQDDNVSLPAQPQYGNDADYTLRRLKRDAPELAQRVLSGEMSTNAAAIQAGFRKRTISIPTDDADRAARSIRANMQPAIIRELIDCLDGL